MSRVSRAKMGAAALAALGSSLLAGCGVPPEEEGRDDGLEEGVEHRQFALETAPNPAGKAETLHLSGTIDRTNPFFQPLGSNPRSCETCHSAQQGWTINRDGVTKLFKATLGLDPLFNLVDEGKRPDADISTPLARLLTFGATLNDRALTRFTRTVPATHEFVVDAVSDPWGWSTPAAFSSFRRPTPTANESKVSSTTWTGVPNPTVLASVTATAVGATRLHLQRDPANPLPADLAAAEGNFMFGVIFAQSEDNAAGRLNDDGARGGPRALLEQEFFVGINDPASPTFTPRIFNIFDAWARFNRKLTAAEEQSLKHVPLARRLARASIYRGQEVFNGAGRCGGCHNAPNVGGSSTVRFFDIGTAFGSNCNQAIVPMLTVRNKTTGETKVTCDLGRALGSGLWADLGKFRAPPLRGLAARAPYFHDGQAADLDAVVRLYDTRFNLRLTASQKKDLVAFLRAL